MLRLIHPVFPAESHSLIWAAASGSPRARCCQTRAQRRFCSLCGCGEQASTTIDASSPAQGLGEGCVHSTAQRRLTDE